MIDAFFWYTGLVFWISVFAAIACLQQRTRAIVTSDIGV